MENFIEEVKSTVAHNHNLELVTILSTGDSAPRKAGAQMAVLEDGKIYGTVGGGRLELVAISTALELLKEKMSEEKHYDLNPESSDGTPMACGGDAVLAYRYIDASSISTKELDEVLGVTAPKGKVYVVGGGHVGTELVKVLSYVGFSVVVYDNRPDFAVPERYPDAKEVIIGEYTEFLEKVSITKDDYICIMTQGHSFDAEVEYLALQTPATYIGCIGSRKKTAYNKALLLERGIPEEQYARIHAPIGIELLGDTPEEIAISIAAELIRHRGILDGLDKYHQFTPA